MRLLAHAKINLYLNVLGRLPDGYHSISSVMQTISLADEILIEPSETTEVVCPERPDLCDRENLAIKACEVFEKRVGKVSNVRISIDKRIPVAAGLAGGSADAAATLIALNMLFDAGLSDAALAGLGAKIGADVPFCLSGGTMLAEGKGEKLSSLPAMPYMEIVVACPPFALSTQEVYGKLDELNVAPLDCDARIVNALMGGSLSEFVDCLDNRLTVAATYLRPETDSYLEVLSSIGALGVSMSGSGPSVFGLFEIGKGEKAAEEMRAAFPDAFAGLAIPGSKGVEMAGG